MYVLLMNTTEDVIFMAETGAQERERERDESLGFSSLRYKSPGYVVMCSLMADKEPRQNGNGVKMAVVTCLVMDGRRPLMLINVIKYFVMYCFSANYYHFTGKRRGRAATSFNHGLF